VVAFPVGAEVPVPRGTACGSSSSRSTGATVFVQIVPTTTTTDMATTGNSRSVGPRGADHRRHFVGKGGFEAVVPKWAACVHASRGGQWVVVITTPVQVRVRVSERRRDGASNLLEVLFPSGLDDPFVSADRGTFIRRDRIVRSPATAAAVTTAVAIAMPPMTPGRCGDGAKIPDSFTGGTGTTCVAVSVATLARRSVRIERREVVVVSRALAPCAPPPLTAMRVVVVGQIATVSAECPSYQRSVPTRATAERAVRAAKDAWMAVVKIPAGRWRPGSAMSLLTRVVGSAPRGFDACTEGTIVSWRRRHKIQRQVRPILLKVMHGDPVRCEDFRLATRMGAVFLEDRAHGSCVQVPRVLR
jgi:hypothetical protein